MMMKLINFQRRSQNRILKIKMMKIMKMIMVVKKPKRKVQRKRIVLLAKKKPRKLIKFLRSVEESQNLREKMR